MSPTDRAAGSATGLPIEALPFREDWLRHLATNLLHLIVMPTERCNLRCVYCYETFEHGKMPPEVVNGIKALLERRAPRLDRLRVDWFGGEPLLALDVVEDLQAHLGDLTAKHPRLRVRSAMTTNGCLLKPSTLARLVRSGISRFQISVDGGPESHDARRRLASGSGTFERVWGNLVAARELDERFEIVVRTHVDRNNLEHVRAFLPKYRRDLGGDNRYELFLRPVSRLGGPNDARLPVLDQGLAEREIKALKDEARRLGLGLCDPDAGSGGVCYASAGNSWVIRSTGEIGKCTVALAHRANRVGRISADGRLDIDNGRLNGWLRGLLTDDAETAACPMKGLADQLLQPDPLTSIRPG